VTWGYPSEFFSGVTPGGVPFGFRPSDSQPWVHTQMMHSGKTCGSLNPYPSSKIMKNLRVRFVHYSEFSFRDRSHDALD
jgi:hypothetical protein